MNLTVTVEKPHETPEQLARQFASGVFGLSLSDFAQKIIHEIQEEKIANGGEVA